MRIKVSIRFIFRIGSLVCIFLLLAVLCRRCLVAKRLRGEILVEISKTSDLENARRLLACGVNPNTRSINGLTPLGLACLFPRHEYIEFLLASGADPNVLGEWQGDGGRKLFPLHLVVVNTNQDAQLAMELLLEYGADPNSRDDIGATPLMHAAMQLNAEAIRKLIRHGAKVGLLDNQGRDVQWYIEKYTQAGSACERKQPLTINLTDRSLTETNCK